ncbi:MAG: MotE family protein [Devosiaceae bacterium]
MRSIRLLPVVIATSLMLLGLKGFNFVMGPENAITGVEPVLAQDEDADAEELSTADQISQSAAALRAAAEAAAASRDAQGVNIDDLPVESSRDALIDRLGDRRVLMEEREQDLRVREQLLQAAERRLEERLAELTALEERVSAVADAEEERASDEIARLVQVYSAMRAKDAAAIFDLLDLPILMEVSNAMNPRKMADILGEMQPEVARRLTIALAGATPRVEVRDDSAMGELPRIEGVPVQ